MSKIQVDNRNEGDDGTIPLKNLATIDEADNHIKEPDQDAETVDVENGVAVSNRRLQRKLCQLPKWLKSVSLVVIIVLAVLATIYLLMNYLSDKKKSRKAAKSGLKPPNPDYPPMPSASELYVFEKAAVCSDSDVCSEIGRNMFLKNGSIVDAAIASLFCTGITTMQSMGIGGGFIANIFIKVENRAYTLDAREAAPFAAFPEMFKGTANGSSMHGPLSIAVPGEVSGYWEAYKRFGRLPWKELVNPAIEVCEKGYKLTKHMYDALVSNVQIRRKNHLRSIFDDKTFRKMFVNETEEKFYRPGTHIQPHQALCNTYRLIAAQGGPEFYNGSLARLISEDLRDIGSLIELSDLQSYRPIWRDSLRVDIKDSIMYVVPPPGSGALLAFIVNILDGYNFTSSDLKNTTEQILTYHRISEAFKFAFAKRSELGDLRYKNLTSLMMNLTSLEYAHHIRGLIDDTKVHDDPKYYGGEFWTKTDNGTAQMSLVAPNGDAISITSTINFYFGSSEIGRRTGIIFNSCMDDFSNPGVENFFQLPVAEQNFIAPEKRPMSSMSPTIIATREGDVRLVIGAAGGTKIPSAVSLVILRTMLFDQNIKEALDEPRFHHQLIPNKFTYEYGILQDVILGLEAKGHVTERYHDRGSTMCGIMKNSTAIYANADFRKKGDVAGF